MRVRVGVRVRAGKQWDARGGTRSGAREGRVSIISTYRLIRQQTGGRARQGGAPHISRVHRPMLCQSVLLNDREAVDAVGKMVVHLPFNQTAIRQQAGGQGKARSGDAVGKSLERVGLHRPDVCYGCAPVRKWTPFRPVEPNHEQKGVKTFLAWIRDVGLHPAPKGAGVQNTSQNHDFGVGHFETPIITLCDVIKCGSLARA